MTESTSVKRHIWIDAPLEKVWRALTEKEELLRWYTWDCEIDFREGGTGNYNHGWGAWTSGTYEEIVEYEKFVLHNGDENRTVTTLTPEKGGVTVAIEYQFPALANQHAAKENMAFGTYQFMRNLKSVLEKDTDLRPTFWKSWIGVRHTSVRPEDRAPEGSVILSVENGTPAQDAGLTEGDVVTEVNGQKIQSYEQLENMITPLDPNDSLSLIVERNGEERKVDCATSPYPREYRTKVEW